MASSCLHRLMPQLSSDFTARSDLSTFRRLATDVKHRVSREPVYGAFGARVHPQASAEESELAHPTSDSHKSVVPTTPTTTHARHKSIYIQAFLFFFCLRAGQNSREFFPGPEMVIQAQKGDKSLQTSPHSVTISKSLAKRANFQASFNNAHFWTTNDPDGATLM